MNSAVYCSKNQGNRQISNFRRHGRHCDGSTYSSLWLLLLQDREGLDLDGRDDRLCDGLSIFILDLYIGIRENLCGPYELKA